MGMGEPLMNYKNVLAAIDKITDSEALGMSPRRIVLSTSGIPKLIRKMADDKVKFGLAVSLHSARQEIREQIMPFAKKFPLAELIEALEYWYAYTKKQITSKYSKIRKDQAIFIYCNDGRKSLSLANKLSRENYNAIYVLENGINNT
mgnify:CR=1 FL=1